MGLPVLLPIIEDLLQMSASKFCLTAGDLVYKLFYVPVPAESDLNPALYNFNI